MISFKNDYSEGALPIVMEEFRSKNLIDIGGLYP